MFTHRQWLPRITATLALVGFIAPALATPVNKPMLEPWGIDLQHFSSTVKPGDDFYTYVNEGWMKQAQLPQGMPSMNAFTEVYLRSEEQLQTILTELLSAEDKGELHQQQIVDLYRSYMDEARINAQGLTPIQAELNAVMAASTPADFARWMARPLQESVMGMGVDLDEKDPERYSLYLGQSGLGLPGREYYLSDEAPFPAVRKAYQSYIEGVLARARIDRPAERATDILRFETDLATAHWTPAQQRERVRNYNPMSMEEQIGRAHV